MGQIYAITPFTLLDYPDKMACIVWFAGCNMRCAFCHNPDIVTSKGAKEESEVLDFLQNRTGRLDGVVFSGGEPTLYPNLVELIRKVKSMGFQIKLDTNGSRPEVLRQLLAENLLDYVAMDFKCPPEKAEGLVGTGKLWPLFEESLQILIEAAKHGLAFEVRTTYHTDLMTDEDINWMIQYLDKVGYAGTYYLQNIASTGDKTIGNIAKPERAFDPEGLTKPQNFVLEFRNFKA